MAKCKFLLLCGGLSSFMLGQSAWANNEVQLTVSGTVPTHCVMQDDDKSLDMDLGDLTKGGEVSAKIAVNCNTPFTVNMSSKNGRLLNESAAQTFGSFASGVDYKADFSIPLDDGTKLLLSNCESGDLQAETMCRQISSGGKTAIKQVAELKLRWSAPQDPLLSGAFKDVLTIELNFPA